MDRVSWVLSKIVDRKSGGIIGTLLCAKNRTVEASKYTWLAYVTFRYENRPLPSLSELEQFECVQDVLEYLEKQSVLAWVATMKHNGVCDYIVYCRDKREGLAALKESLKSPKPKIKFVRDESWKQFQDLLDMQFPLTDL